MSNATGSATGVNCQGSTLRISRSTISASGSTSSGILGINMTVDNSEIAGATATVSGSSNVIGGSKLDGGAASAFNTCAGVWDESYTFSAGTCP